MPIKSSLVLTTRISWQTQDGSIIYNSLPYSSNQNSSTYLKKWVNESSCSMHGKSCFNETFANPIDYRYNILGGWAIYWPNAFVNVLHKKIRWQI
mgnify:CR=1 FL=1